jgi:hypothetical protein
VPGEPYFFVPTRDVFAPSVAAHVVSGEPATALGARTRPYVKASPVVGVPVQPATFTLGPPPSTIGIDAARVTRVGRTDATLLRARQFARPSTAQALGGSAPVPHVVRPRLVAHPAAYPRAVARTTNAKRK